MTYRKILVPLAGSDPDRQTLAVATTIARQFAGHVVGLFVRPDPSDALPYVGFGLSGSALQDMINAANKSADEASQKAEAILKEVAGAGGIALLKTPGAQSQATADYHVVQGRFSDVIERETRLSDLVVFGALQGNDLGAREALETVLISGSRPILYAPAPLSANFAKRIAIGYDGSAAAAHSVTAALPYLKRATSVELYEVTIGAKASRNLDQLEEYLALHGIPSAKHIVDPGSKPIGETLLGTVQKAGCDMLVMGGYGHSRIHEFVLGGATRHMLSQTKTLPILMAH
jgi:nucleotide-binding universal stress UspA family protein